MKATLLVFVMIIALLGSSVALAQPGSGYDLSWWTVDGGGGTLSGGGYSLTGTLGQAEAGAALSGGGYTLVGGFWPGSSDARYKIYLSLIMRSP